MKQHNEYLSQALQLAALRRGFCAPNPAVGALLVKGNEILAQGYHLGSGHSHAEVEVLTPLGIEHSQGATLYVTLEPCCHWGKTPPCTELIIKQGIKKVFYGYADPNPLVAGKGAQQLREAGIECQLLNMDSITDFYRSYAHWWQYKTPWVTAKIALSLDGKIAGPQGNPVAITGAALQNFTHQWRKQSDAILTSAKTINADNPQLNVRLNGQTFRKPIYILDTHLSLSLNAQIFKTAEKIIIFHGPQIAAARLTALQALNAQCVAIPVDASGLNLSAVIKYIGNAGVHDLWVEAGGKCFAALITQKLVQRSFIYQSEKSLGTAAQAAFATDFNLAALLQHTHAQQFGNDKLYAIESGV